MSNRRVNMNRLRRLFHLLEQDISQRKACEKLSMGRNVCSGYVKKVETTGKSYRELLELSDESLGELLQLKSYQHRHSDIRLDVLTKLMPQYKVDLENPKVTLILLWEEYKHDHSDGYGYTQFKEHLLRYIKKERYSYHNDWIPAHELQVDFAGAPLYVTNICTGAKTPCPVLVCSLPFSSLVYVMALINARQANFYEGLNRCLLYLGGVPKSVKSDNMSQWVKRANRYEPAFTDAAVQWGSHNNTTLMATRVARPTDKANVESHVNIVYRRIYARVRKETFYSIDELNGRILQLLDELNNRPMQGKSLTRMERFSQQEKPLLQPLARTMFEIKQRKEFTVNSTYHVQITEDRHFYSVPYQYVNGKAVMVYTTSEVEIYVDSERIASHRRNYTEGGYSTLEEHLPEHHKAYMRSRNYNAAYYLRQAAYIGPNTLQVVKQLLESKTFIQQSYISCLGIIRLAGRYEAVRVEAACRRANAMHNVYYRSIKSILERNLDMVDDLDLTPQKPLPKHENIRGAEMYN